MTELTITEADVHSFRDKLDAWAVTLSDSEQAILAMVATRAFPDPGSGGDEVQGYAGKVSHSDFHFVRVTDKSSPKLFMLTDLGSLVGIHVSIEGPGASEA